MNYLFQQAFAEDEFSGLSSLIHLYLDHNQIQSFGTTLQKLENLVVLNITHNNIKLITTDQLPYSLKRIYLAGESLRMIKIKGEQTLTLYEKKN